MKFDFIEYIIDMITLLTSGGLALVTYLPLVNAIPEPDEIMKIAFLIIYIATWLVYAIIIYRIIKKRF